MAFAEKHASSNATAIVNSNPPVATTIAENRQDYQRHRRGGEQRQPQLVEQPEQDVVRRRMDGHELGLPV